MKYVKRFHKNELESIMKCYDYYGHGIDEKPTLNQYIAEAEKNNLSLVGYRRFMPQHSTNVSTPLPPTVLNQYEDTSLEDVLTNIRSFRSDVELVDLRTSYILPVFQKKTKKLERITNRIKQLEKEGYAVYRKV